MLYHAMQKYLIRYIYMQVTQDSLPITFHEYYLITVIVLTISALACVLALLLSRRQIRKLSAARKELLQAKTQLERVSRERDEFISRTSHEIRALVQHVMFLCDAISSGTITKDHETIRESKNCAKKLTGLIDNLLRKE